MHCRHFGGAQMIGRHHGAQRHDEGTLRIGKEGGNAGERLVGIGVKDVQDRADQQRMARLLPVVAPVERSFRIDEDVRDVLHVAHFVGTAAHLEQRVVARGTDIGRVEEQAVREASAPTSGQLPVLALDIVDDGRPRPAHQRRYDEADALAGPGRRERHDMLGAVVPEIALA